MTQPHSLAGKVAVITGSSRGSGAAIARAFADAGATVVLAARSKPELDQVAADITAAGHRALAVPTDMQDAAQIQALMDKTVQAFGRLDILVNNAGGAGAYVEGGSAGLLDTSLEAWDGLFNLNLRGPFIAAQAAARIMKTQKSGVIINVTSVHGLFTRPAYHGYSAAKSALHELTAMWAVELGQYGIRVNEIAPGIIAAGLNGGRLLTSPEARQEREKIVPLGRLGMPEDVAAAAVFLASDAAGYVSGATLTTSGGWRGDMAPAPRSA